MASSSSRTKTKQGRGKKSTPAPAKAKALSKVASKVKPKTVAKKASKVSSQATRQVLGRGLSSLMRSTLPEVDVSSQLKSQPPAADTSHVGEKEEIIVAPRGDLASKIEVLIDEPKEKNAFGSDEILEAEEIPLDGSLRSLSVSKVFRNESQPRQFFAKEDIESLSRSIRESGVLQPIIVRPAGNGTRDFEIVAGERRFRAAKLAGLLEIPAIVRELNDRETLELAIVENVQRSDLNPIEEAEAYKRLAEEFGSTQEQIARTVGKDRVSVSNALRLLKLPKEVQDELTSGALSAGHGRALLMLESTIKQKALARRILKENLSVRATEALARGVFSGETDSKRGGDEKPSKSSSVVELENRFRRALGTKVSLSVSARGAGELRIHFFSKAELESLLDKLDA